MIQSRAKSQYAVPSGAWDAHMHVTDLAKFPSTKRANPEYEPHSSTLDGAKHHASQISVPNLVFVQVSTYGKDNSCLLWCLEQMMPTHGRGVVDFDPATIQEQTLKEWHAKGVRGVRVNYKSVGETPSADDMRAKLLALDKAIRPLKTWAIHIHVSMDAMETLKEVLPSIQSKVCIDHMGSPPKGFDSDELTSGPSWQALLDMCNRDNVFVKVSAPYRFQEAEAWQRFEQPVKQLLACRAGNAGVFASDWPHTRFESTVIELWVDMCLDWCGSDNGLRNKLFRDNSKVLYDID